MIRSEALEMPISHRFPGVDREENGRLDRQAAAEADRKAGRFTVEPIWQFTTAPVQKRWLVKGIIAQGETSAWIAPPGGMKSALMAELAFCVANQEPWHGRVTKEVSGVVYFALERADLVRRRLRAHVERSGMVADVSEMPIFLISSTVDLMAGDSVGKVMKTIEHIHNEHYAITPRLLIFDTFAKLVAAGGGNEDKAADQGKVFANIQRIKERVGGMGNPGPHVALVGHTGKDEARGSRGSNAILGDADVMVTITGDEIKTATVTKANDAPEGVLFSFTSEIHKFGVDEDGEPITVNVVSSEAVEAQTSTYRRDKWPKGLKLVHESIAGALLEKGADHRVNGDGPMVKAVNVTVARAIHAQRFVSAGEGDRDAAERQAWRRNFAKARQSDLIGAETANGLELIWLIAA